MKKKILIGLLVLSVIGAAVGYKAYEWIFLPNTNFEDQKELYIASGTDYNQLLTKLSESEVVDNLKSFDAVAKLMEYPESVKPGRYLLEAGRSNKEIISKLRAGHQDPVKVTISTGRYLSDIVGVVAPRIEADSLEILQALTDSEHLADLGLNAETAITQIIPNTYEFFWNTSAEAFVERMNKEADKFWDSNDRKTKLDALDMSKEEVMTLASIVQAESNYKPEQPTIAGVYLNRIRQGIPLQADPTTVFGIGDFTIRRVLNRHLAVETPYNTHLNQGLPPGPINMPYISTIDAVLNAEKHDYIFFCAKPGYNNGHLFAVDNAQHERNARIYHRWLDSEGIRG